MTNFLFLVRFWSLLPNRHFVLDVGDKDLNFSFAVFHFYFLFDAFDQLFFQ